MIALSTGTQIRIAAGVTDLRRGFTGLSTQVQTVLKESPFSGRSLLGLFQNRGFDAFGIEVWKVIRHGFRRDGQADWTLCGRR
ncbi:MAG TPA: IS66 family insertion sequence element accessory protein TnpB [Terriglobia bacterium]